MSIEHPQIGELYMLREDGHFECLQTGTRSLAGQYMSDAVQGEWIDGPHPYEDDPLIVTVDALILDDTFQTVVFTDTNQPIKGVAWSNMQDKWFKVDLADLTEL